MRGAYCALLDISKIESGEMRLEASCTPGWIKVSYPVYLLTRGHFGYEALQQEEFKGFARTMQVSELNPDNNINYASGASGTT